MNQPKVAEDEGTTALQTLACHAVVHLCPLGAWFLYTILVWVSLGAHALPAPSPTSQSAAVASQFATTAIQFAAVKLQPEFSKSTLHPILMMSADLHGTCQCTVHHEQIGMISSALTCAYAPLLVSARSYSSKLQHCILWLNEQSSLTCQCRSGGLFM